MSCKYIKALIMLFMLPVLTVAENLIPIYNNSICAFIGHYNDKDSLTCQDFQIDSILKGTLPENLCISHKRLIKNKKYIFLFNCRGTVQRNTYSYYAIDDSRVQALLNAIKINGLYESYLPYMDSLVGMFYDQAPTGTWTCSNYRPYNTFKELTIYEKGIPVKSTRYNYVRYPSTVVSTYTSGCLTQIIETEPDSDCFYELRFDSTMYRETYVNCVYIDEWRTGLRGLKRPILEMICRDEQIVESTELISSFDSVSTWKSNYAYFKNIEYHIDDSYIESKIVCDLQSDLCYFESIKYYNNKYQLVEQIAYIPFTSENFTILFFKDSLSNTLIENGTGYYYSNKLIPGSREADGYDYCSGNFKDSVKVGTWIFCDFKKCEKREYVDGVIISTENCDTCVSPVWRSRSN